MDDFKNPFDGSDTQSDDNEKESQNTTHDVRAEAEEAIKRYFESHPTAEMTIEKVAPIKGDSIHLLIEVQGWADPIQVIFSTEAVIGRRDPMLGFTPEIDLTSFGGYQMGISRKHACIQRKGDRLELVDLDSRNGTFLNGKRLEPNQPAHLTHHDEIRLGKIIMTIYVQQEELT